MPTYPSEYFTNMYLKEKRRKIIRNTLTALFFVFIAWLVALGFVHIFSQPTLEEAIKHPELIDKGNISGMR